MYSLAGIWQAVQARLFPYLEEHLDQNLTPKLEQLISVLEVLRIEDHVHSPYRQWTGRPESDRRTLARAFVAKAVYNLPTTGLLRENLLEQPSLRRVCGFELRCHVPSESTFSRAFALFAEGGLGDRVLAALRTTYVGEQVVMHVSVDSSAIPAREKAAKKAPKPVKERRKRGRPRKDECVAPAEPTRLQRQMDQPPDEAIDELPKQCDVSAKRNSQGHTEWWKGWKIHIAWADDAIPLDVVTTSASLHDSQVAIPLIKRVAGSVTSLYDLMDAAYDAKEIDLTSRQLGHVPIIDSNARGGEKVEFDPATRNRFNVRTTAERGNSRLKDEFGGRHLRVRGHPKAHAHLMFGILALFADQLLKPFTT